MALLGCFISLSHALYQVLAQGEVVSLAGLSWKQILMMSLMGCSDAAFLIFITMAYMKGKPSTIALFSYTSLLYTFVADVLIFSQPVSLG